MDGKSRSVRKGKPGNNEGARGARGGVEVSRDTVMAGATEKEKDQKPGESPISSEKCLSQEKREPLGQMSHRERLKKQIWAELDSQYDPRTKSHRQAETMAQKEYIICLYLQ